MLYYLESESIHLCVPRQKDPQLIKLKKIKGEENIEVERDWNAILVYAKNEMEKEKFLKIFQNSSKKFCHKKVPDF